MKPPTRQRFLNVDTVLDVDLESQDVEVEVRDEAGNVAGAREALIRGVPNPDGGGCDCRWPGRWWPAACGEG